ncbi:MAG TPA: hypothetical protein VFZ09_47500 [Archangium sp.]|uniref:alpha/beta hydrolase family protein n=1 Tax=Archangium sp. TaxID=1872627 RepID=UPI002E2EC7E6|nr:hypothetical protein [Archangium sp.]HEX5753922.1 hypothetical protein [Archangium sp.]
MHSRFLVGVGLWALALLLVGCEDAPPAPAPIPGPITTEPIQLPAPTGPHPVGKRVTSLVDFSRGGLFPGEPEDRRELSIHIWYPCEPPAGAPLAPYISPRIMEVLGFPPELVPLIRTNAFADAPLSPARDAFPVVLFSPGFGMNAELYTVLLEDLASHGYVVVGIDHTFIATLTVFPDGREVPLEKDLALSVLPESTPFNRGRQLASITTLSALLSAYERVMADDDSFVLSELEKWNAGAPGGWFAGRLEVASAGVFGHSMGGASSIRALGRDPRFDAGINIDGYLQGPPERSIEQPFMLLSTPDLRQGSPGLNLTYESLKGAGYEVEVSDAAHLNFSDAGPILTHFLGREAAGQVAPLGSIDPVRVIQISRAYVRALFEQHLRGLPSPLLRGPSEEYPEVTFGSR